MVLNDRQRNPIKLGHIYADWKIVEKDKIRPFPMNYTGGLCEVIELDQEKPYLKIQYEISGGSEGSIGHAAIDLGKRLIPLGNDEVAELIKDRKRRLSFLENFSKEEKKIYLPGHPAP